MTIQDVVKYSRYVSGILLTGLTPQHFCACPEPGPGFPTSYVMFFLNVR
jgi:hypothetical protein